MAAQNKFLDPRPNTFPGATIWISKAFRHLFKPITHSCLNGDWNNSTKCMDMGLVPDPACVGKIMHMWVPPGWEGQDSWGVVSAIGAPCGANLLYMPTISEVTSSNYRVTISIEPAYTINGIWDRIHDQAPPTPAGAIRWGDLWLYVGTALLTHDITMMHFDGFS